jgi:protocatechuate 3,4-dioxygenase beta subunit
VQRTFGLIAAAEAVVILVLAGLLLARPADTEPVVPAPSVAAPGGESGSSTVAPSSATSPPAPAAGSRTAVDAPAAWSASDGAGVVVFGSITDAEGAPIEGVRVSFAHADQKRPIGASVQRGGYAAAGLTPGTWKVLGRGDGFRQLEREYAVEPRSPQRLDLQLERALMVLVKIVTAEGEPLQDALDALQRERKLAWDVDVGVIATRELPPGELPLTEHASIQYGLGEWRPSRGRFVVQNDGRKLPPKEYAGELQVAGEAPVFVSAVLRHVLLATAPLAKGEGEVTLTVPLDVLLGKLCTVRLRVLDDTTGQPLADARVALHDRQSGGGGVPVREDGTIVLEHLRPGLLVLEVRAKDREQLREYVRLETGQVNDLGDIRLGKPVSIKGVVVDAQGKPAQARMSYRRVDRIAFPQPWDLGMGLQPNESGEFALGHVGPGRYVITAADEGRVGHAVVDTLAGPVADLRVVLLPATTVKLQNKGGREGSYFVMVRDVQGLCVNAARLVGGFDRSLQLPPGRYTLDVHDSHRLLRSEGVVAAGQPLAVRIP